MDLTTNLCGLTLRNPLLPGSGPLTGDGERMVYLAGLGLGAVVSKTIAPKGAVVARPCICGTKNAIMNSELWSEYDAATWIDSFLPQVKAGVDIPVIVNMGYTAEDIADLMPKLDPFAEGWELIPRYIGNDLVAVGEIVATARKISDKPIWVKMNANLADPVGFAKTCVAKGANGVTAITSLGPNMVIDIKRRKPLIGTEGGYVWTSGAPIKPLALATVSMIKDAVPDISIIGCGGVTNEEDVIEFLLAGADAVEMLSQAMLKGKTQYTRIVERLPQALEKYDFTSVEEVKRTGLTKGNLSFEPSFPVIDHESCNKCGICEKNCPYYAMAWENEIVTIDREKCFGCGLCQSRCPTQAIDGVL